MNTVWLSREVRTIKQARKRGGSSLETKIILFFHFMKHAQAIMGQMQSHLVEGTMPRIREKADVSPG